jgi:sulfatase maturation enzyme AslB (radical SAM superfamily)
LSSLTRISELTPNGLYIEPCTLCPLECSLCYTAHDQQRLLDARWIRRAIAIYAEALETVGVFWCGLGEVLYDRRFAPLLDELDTQYGDKLVHVIQTSGQVPHSPVLERPAHRFFAVSIDLPVAFNEHHRGAGYTERAEAFITRALQNGTLGVQIKSLLTLKHLPHLAESFQALQQRLSQRSGLSMSEIQNLVTLEPILPFQRDEVSQIASSAFVPQGGTEDRAALLEAVKTHLPDRWAYLTNRPRTIELSITADGLFNCCEAVEGIGDLDELSSLNHATILDRLRRSTTRCDACALRDVC